MKMRNFGLIIRTKCEMIDATNVVNGTNSAANSSFKYLLRLKNDEWKFQAREMLNLITRLR